MKRLLFFCLGTLATISAHADLIISTASNGAVTLTLEASGDLHKEFTPIVGEYHKFTPSSKISAILNATSIKVVTSAGVQMNNDDLYRLCGEDENENEFPNVTTLDLQDARVFDDSKLTHLSYMDNLKTLIFPSTTTQIPDMCLVNNSCKIVHVIIPDNQERDLTIGIQAFATPTLRTVVLGAVKSGRLGTQVFLNCTGLTTVDYHYGWTTIGQQAFMGCTALKKVVLPEGLKTIEQGAFSESAIEAIRLPNTLEKIESMAFNTPKLKMITIPASVKEIARETFQNCSALTDVYVLGTTTKIANGAFSSTNTYNYTYKDAPGNAMRDHYIANGGNAVTILHYPAAAKNTYLNQDILTHNAQYSEYIQDQYGNYSAKSDQGKYTSGTGDYAGWQNFMLAQQIREEEQWEDDKRIEDKWYSICVPFNMTQEQIESAYGATCEVVKFSGVKIDRSISGGKTITLEFKEKVMTIKAHCPYMIHPGIHSGTTIGVRNFIVGITKQPENTISLTNNKTDQTADGITYTFIGNYTAEAEMPYPSYYYYSGKDPRYIVGFDKRTTAGGKWNKYTALIKLDKDNGVNSSPTTVFDAETPNNQLTPVTTIILPQAIPADIIFDMQGRALNRGNRMSDRLPTGLYLLNGKKHIKH